MLGVLVGGSIAHGFATATSDVDLLIVVSDAEWERRLAAGDTTELDRESATYEGGYVDCKYTSLGLHPRRRRARAARRPGSRSTA